MPFFQKNHQRAVLAPVLLLLLVLTFTFSGVVLADASGALKQYFDIDESSPHSVPLDELQQGCPRPGCIPAIDAPKFIKADEVDFMAADDLVLALKHDGIARAYPIVILDRHEIVNDHIGDLPIVVAWCPLCGSGLVYERNVGGETQKFAVSGFLHNSDLVMFDEATRTLWGQISGEAVAGSLTGTQLKPVQATIIEWSSWRDAHPETEVLSTDTGFNMRYQGSVYGDYTTSRKLMFPVQNNDFRIHPKTVVFGLRHGDDAVAITRETLKKNASVETQLDGRDVSVELSADGTARARFAESGEAINTTRLFWFGWLNFNKNTRLVTSD